jgi:hypothetical protein
MVGCGCAYNVAVGKNDLNRLYGMLKQSVLKRTALSCSAGKTTSDRDPRKLHHHGRYQPVSCSDSDKLVHGDIRLNHGYLLLCVDVEDPIEESCIDHFIASELGPSCACGGSMVNSKWLLEGIKMLDAAGDIRDSLIVAVHGTATSGIYNSGVRSQKINVFAE